MSINALMTFKLVGRLKKKPGARIAAMGYPDIVAPEQLINDLTIGLVAPLQYRDDSEAICTRHGIPAGRKIPDAASFFAAFGATMDVFDIVQERGGEILCDLNDPMDPRHACQYDFVLDVGTLEHCFNIGQAARNMVSLLGAGGVIFHENPFNWGNHGFYGLCPTWYADFYGQAGFQLHDLRFLLRDGKQIPLAGAERTRRFNIAAGEVNCYAMAERTELLPITWPTQTKYKKKQ